MVPVWFRTLHRHGEDLVLVQKTMTAAGEAGSQNLHADVADEESESCSAGL